MHPVKSRIVRIADRQFEIRAWWDGRMYAVRAFDGERPWGLTFGVAADTQYDFEVSHGNDAIDELMNVAENELRRAYAQ